MNPHPHSDTDRTPPTDAESEIEAQRQLIDRLDGEILRLLNDRLAAAAAIGEIKQRLDLGVLDSGREVACLPTPPGAQPRGGSAEPVSPEDLCGSHPRVA